MHLSLEAPVLTLTAGQLLSLDDACGTRIRSDEGTVWITEEGESRDFVVGPGEMYVVTRPGRTLVQAMVASRLALREEDLHCAANDRSATPRWPLEPAPGYRTGDELLMEARHRAQSGGV